MTALRHRPQPKANPPVPSTKPSLSLRRSVPWKRVIIDSALLATGVLSFASLALGSTLLHVIAGLAFAGTAIVHVFVNRTWVKGTWRRRERLPSRSRTNLVVGVVLAALWALITASGIAEWLGAFPTFGEAHGPIAGLLVAATGIHLWLHRRWIAAVARTRSRSQ